MDPGLSFHKCVSKESSKDRSRTKKLFERKVVRIWIQTQVRNIVLATGCIETKVGSDKLRESQWNWP